MARRRRRGTPGGLAPVLPAGEARPEPRPPAGPRAGAALLRRVQRLVRRRPALCVAALVALHLLLALLTFEPRPHTGGDNAAYISLARSLIDRGAYLELWDPAEAPHTKYPPVFPAILAVAMLLGLNPWVQLKLVVLAFSSAAVAFSFLWMRARRRHATALAVGIIIAIAPGVLREGRWLLSDVPFWAFTMIALWAFQTMQRHGRTRFAAGAVATILAYFTRSAGLPLLLAALGWLAWRRRWVQLGALAGLAAVPALLWSLRSRAFAPADYVSEFWLVDPYYPVLGRAGPADLAIRLGENALKYASVHLPTLLTGAPSLPVLPLSVLILAFAAWGWSRSALSAARRGGQQAPPLSRHVGIAEVFLPLYLGLILLWPSVWSGERFLLPVLPLLLFFAVGPLVRLCRRLAGRHEVVAAAGVVVVMLVAAAPGLVRGMQVGHECTRRYWAGERYPCLGAEEWDDFFAISERSGELLPSDAVVLNRKARLFHVLSGGLKSRPYPLVPEPGALFAAADSAGARYVIFDQLDMVAEVYLRPVLIRRAHAFCLMAVEAGTATVLFGILPDAAAAEDADAAAEDGTIGFPFCPADYWRSPQVREDYMRQLGERHGA